MYWTLIKQWTEKNGKTIKRVAGVSSCAKSFAIRFALELQYFRCTIVHETATNNSNKYSLQTLKWPYLFKNFSQAKLCQLGHLMCRFLSIFLPLYCWYLAQGENHYFCAKSFSGAVQLDNEKVYIFLLTSQYTSRWSLSCSHSLSRRPCCRQQTK